MSVPQAECGSETKDQNESTAIATENQTETVVAPSDDEKAIDYLIHIKDNNNDQVPPTLHTMLVPESELLRVAQKHNSVAYSTPLFWIKETVNTRRQLENGMIWNNERVWEMRIAADLLCHAKSHHFRQQASVATQTIKAEHILELYTHGSINTVDDDRFNLCSSILFNVYFEIHSMQNCMANTALMLSNFEVQDVISILDRKRRKTASSTPDVDRLTPERIRDEWSMKARRLAKQPVLMDTVLSRRFADALMDDDNLEYFKQRSTAPAIQITDADIVMLVLDCD